MIIAGADNRPSMLEKSLYDSWKSLDGTTRTKKYEELSATEKIQADCDCKATNIVLQVYPPTHPSQPQINQSSLPPSHPYQSQVNHQTSSILQIAYNSPQPLTEFPQIDSGLAVPVFTQGDNLISCLNKAMAFLTVVASLRFLSTNNQLRTSSNPRNQAIIQDGKVTVQQIQERQGKSYAGNSYKGNATCLGGNNTRGQARVVKCYNSQGEGHMDRQFTQPKMPRNDACYGFDVLSELPHFETSHNDMDNQSLHAMLDFEQTPIVDFSDNEITSDSNIIS
nr:hypothetical protein [Tanacetum cinerariifolium]